MAGFGGAVKLTGESEYRNALRQIKQSLQEVSSQMNLVTSSYNKNDKSVNTLKSKQEALNTVLKQQKTVVDNAKSAYESFKTKVDQQATAHNALTAKYEKEKAELEKIKNTSGTASTEYQKQKGIVENLAQEVAKSSNNYNANEVALSKLKTTMNNAEATYKKTEKEVENLSDDMDDAGDSADDLGKKTKDSADAAAKAKEGYTVFKNVLANLASEVISKATSALKNLAKETITAGANFESAMSQVGAVSGASAGEIEQLTAKAEEMGAKTKFSATESAQAFNYMAMAGWKTEDMLNGIEGIMNLAAASGADLATTSDIVTDALTAMGYEAGDAGRLADVMAAASSNANTNVEMMGQTFQYAAPIVGALGYNMEDTAVQIGLMANAGIKGEKAGTALRSILTRLSAPPKECAEAMEKLGISMTDSNGEMKSLDTVMGELRTSFTKMSATEQTATAKHIAGQEAMSGLLAIVNAAPKDYEKLKSAVEGSSGAAKGMADTMNDNVSGAMTLLKSQVEGVQISLFQKLEPALRSAIKAASNLISQVDWNSFGNKVKTALDKVMEGLKWLIDHRDIVVGAMKAMLTAFAVTKVYNFTKSLSDMAKGILGVITQTYASTAATTANTAAEGANTVAKGASATATTVLTTAQGVLNKVMAANPVGLLVAALGGLVALFIKLKGKTDEVNEAEKAHQEQLKKTRDKVKENAEAYDELIQSQQDAVNVGMTEISHYENLWDELQSIVDQNGKVKKGYEERAAFISETLSQATGLEIDLTDGVIQKYDELKQSIADVMEQKKAQIILDSQETLYKEAIEGQADAVRGLQSAEEERDKKRAELATLQEERIQKQAKQEEAYNNWLEDTQNHELQRILANANTELSTIDQKIAKKQEEVDKQEAAYSEAEDLFNKYAYNTGVYESNMAAAHAGEYDKMTTVTWEYVKDYQAAGDAEKAQLEDQIKITEKSLSQLKTLKKKSGSDIYDQQIKDGERQLKELKGQLKSYVSTTDTELAKTKVVWSDSLADNLSEITGHKVQFHDEGEGLVSMFVDGEKLGAPKSKKEMVDMINKSINAIAKKKPDAKTAGEDLIDGCNNGIKNQNKQNSVFSSISNFGSRMLNKLKASLQEKSPSRATKEMGEFLLEGLGIGIDKEENTVLKQVSDFGRNVLDELNGELSESVIMGDIGMSNVAAISRRINAATRKQEDQYDTMLGAFKQALHEMKIELDDEVAGKFVERTVTRVVYS